MQVISLLVYLIAHKGCAAIPFEQNFQKVTNDTHNTGNTPFDYKIIMIYGAFDFGIENRLGSRKRTIEPLKSGV